MTLTDILAGHAADLFAGHTVVLSDDYLEKLAAHYQELDTPEASRWFRQLVTEANPERMGFRDAYVCYLRDRQPELMALLRKGLSIGLNTEQVERLQSYKAGLELPTGAEVEDLVIGKANPNGLRSVSLRVMRDVTEFSMWDRRATVYRNALGHWSIDYHESVGRLCDSECSTEWTESDAVAKARGFVFATRIADVDVTESVLSDLRYSASEMASKVKPAKGLTKPRAAVLVRADGLRLEYVSNALLYSTKLQAWGKVEHKTLLSLALGGYIRVYKVHGAMPVADAVPKASTEAHYRLAVCKPSEGK